MDTKNIIATITITSLFTFGLGYVTGKDDSGKFTIHKTRSGLFIVDDTAQSKGKFEAKIYEVLELPTNKKSFQDQEVEFK